MQRLPWVILSGILPFSFLFSLTVSPSHGSEQARPLQTCLVAYGYSYDEAALDKIARNFDLIIWGYPASHFRKYAKIVKKKNPKIIVLFYRDLQAMHTYYQDWKNVETKGDWFLEDGSGKSRLIHNTWKWYAMDIGHPAWGDHLVRRLRKELKENPNWDGVFIDDVWTYFRPEFMTATDNQPAGPPPEYGAGFFEKTKNLIAKLKMGVTNRLLIVNEDFDKGDFLRESDGAMLETFVHTRLFATFTVAPEDWLRSLKALVKSGKKKKFFLANSMIHESATKEEITRTRRFCFATYLLGMHPRSFFSFHLNFNDVYVVDESSLSIGKPKAPFYIKNKIYYREFEKGIVAVNPEKKRIEVTLPTSYKIWGKEPAGVPALEPQTGVVLLK